VIGVASAYFGGQLECGWQRVLDIVMASPDHHGLAVVSISARRAERDRRDHDPPDSRARPNRAAHQALASPRGAYVDAPRASAMAIAGSSCDTGAER